MGFVAIKRKPWGVSPGSYVTGKGVIFGIAEVVPVAAVISVAFGLGAE